MQITFWGATQTVTGSRHLLTLRGGKQLLLDAGLFQGRRKEAEALNRNLPFNPHTLEAVLLSHAHIDHSGLLPYLWKRGFRGKIYATHATYNLCALMLLDSAHVQAHDIRFVNKIHRKRGLPPVEPLYTEADVEGVLKHFVAVSYDAPFSPLPGVEATFRDAGHILGSASITLDLSHRGRSRRLVFTGDVGRFGQPIIRDPVSPPDCDYLITESTYGGVTHTPLEEAREELARVIHRTAARGGKVLIPAFAVGRTQQIVYHLNELWNEGRLPRIPVFVDSPLAVNATGVYQAHPECFDEETRRLLLRDDDPLGFETMIYIRSVERSKALNGLRVPAVIISSSGMCEGGRILHHLRHNIEDSRNTILIVGFCAEQTLCWKLAHGWKKVNIFGLPHEVRAEVHVMHAYSAHADEPDLLRVLDPLDRRRLRRVFLVHGAPDRQEALTRALRRRGFHHITRPTYGASFTL